MMNVSVITLENKQDYIIVSTLEYKNNKYFVLINEDDDNDITIRKILKNDNNDDILVKLDSKEELIEVLNVYNNGEGKGKNE